MRLIKQSYEIEYCHADARFIERIARTCYKSEGKIKSGSDIDLLKKLITRKHFPMLEFGDIVVRFVTNRGVTHELVRHRLCSFAQESTRYVRYNDIEFIEPVWWDKVHEDQKKVFLAYLRVTEDTYADLLDSGWQPQQAREVLPNAIKTEIVVKANLTEWRHILTLRCSGQAHPQMRGLMIPLLDELKDKIPLVFDDI